MSIIDRTTPPPTYPYPRLSIPFPADRIGPAGIRITNLNHGDQAINRLSVAWDFGLFQASNPAALTAMSQLLREGAAARSGFEISETLDLNGAWLKAEASTDSFTISLFSINKTFDNLIPLISEIITKPTFPVDELDTIKESMAAMMEVNLKKVAFAASVDNRRQTFGASHPGSRLQSPGEIRSLSRADIVDAYRELTSQARPAIYIAGLTEGLSDSVDRLAEAISPIVPEAESSARAERFAPEFADTFALIPGASQSAIHISIPTIDRSHPDYITLRFAIMALGGYFGSRLNKNIREDKGLTYGITASLLGYREGAFAEICSQSDPSYARGVVDEIDSEILKLASEPMPTQELRTLKNHATTQLAAMLDSPFSIMDHHITNRNLGIDPHYFAAQLAAIERLTPEQVRLAIKKHILPSPRILSVAGPQKI